MKLSETVFKLAFFGMKYEADDIIDYIAINFCWVISILGALLAAVWIGHVVNAPVGLIAGIAFYVLSMILCHFVFLNEHRRVSERGRVPRPRMCHSSRAGALRVRAQLPTSTFSANADGAFPQWPASLLVQQRRQAPRR